VGTLEQPGDKGHRLGQPRLKKPGIGLVVEHRNDTAGGRQELVECGWHALRLFHVGRHRASRETERVVQLEAGSVGASVIGAGRRSTGLSSMGRWRIAAMMPSRTANHHTTLYEPVTSNR